MIAPDGFTVRPTHDGEPMAYKGTGLKWDGDYEVHVLRFSCDCGFTCEVTTREMDGGPNAVLARQVGVSLQ